MVPTITVILSPNLALKRPMGPGPCSCATAAATVGGPATLRSSTCGCGTYLKISVMGVLSGELARSSKCPARPAAAVRLPGDHGPIGLVAGESDVGRVWAGAGSGRRLGRGSAARSPGVSCSPVRTAGCLCRCVCPPLSAIRPMLAHYDAGRQQGVADPGASRETRASPARRRSRAIRASPRRRWRRSRAWACPGT